MGFENTLRKKSYNYCYFNIYYNVFFGQIKINQKQMIENYFTNWTID